MQCCEGQFTPDAHKTLGGSMDYPLDPGMRTGLTDIDKQHARLLDMLSQLQETLGRGAEEQAVQEALQAMKEYARYHFSHEEGVLRECGFPWLESHAADHAAFVKRLEGFEHGAAEDSTMTGLEMLHFLKQWLVGHIKGKDMEFVSFVLEKRG